MNARNRTMMNTHGGNVGRTFLSARSSDGNVRTTACVLPVLAALVAVVLIIAGLPMHVSAEGAMPTNAPITCRNGGGGCTDCGAGAGSGGGGCGQAGGNPAGACGGGRGVGSCESSDAGVGGNAATLPVEASSPACTPKTNCMIPPCNSGTGPVTDIPIGMAGGGYSIDNVHPAGEAHAGRRIVTLRRVDMKLQPNGGFPLAPSRTYTNIVWSYDQNTEGRSILGPRWHFNYDMHLERHASVPDMILRTSWGEGIVLKSTATDEWKGDAHNGSPVLLVKDANGYTMTQPDPTIVYKFNFNGKLLSMRGSNGNMLTFTYDANGELLTRMDMGHENPALDQDPRFVTLHYDTFTTFTFPSANISRTRLTRITAWNGQSVYYHYDHLGMLWIVANARGEVVECYLNDYSADAHEAFNDDGSVSNDNGPNDPWVQQTGAMYPLLLIVYAREADGQCRSTRKYYYQSDGEVWRIDSADGMIYQINKLGIDTSAYKYEVVWGDGRKTLYDINFSRDPERTTVLDDQGNTVAVTTQQFVEGTLDDDVFDDVRPSQLPKLHVNADGTTTTYTYLNEGSTTAPAWDSIHVKRIDNPDGSWVEYDYDANYRVTEARRPLNKTTRYTYDSEGNVTSVTDPHGHASYSFYDSLGRLVKTEGPTSATVEYAYNTIGLVTCTTDTEGRATLFEYNDIGQQTKVTALGTASTMEYDSKDQLTTASDMLGNKTVYEYDSIGRRIAVTGRLGNESRYVYNNRSRLQNVTDADDNMTTFTYDVWGRLTTFTDTLDHRWEYGYDIFGRQTWEKDPLGKTKTFNYHGMGAGCSGCGTGGAGKLASVTDPDNRTTYFTYDIAGRISKIEYSGTSDYVEFTYDAAGRRTAMYDSRLDTNLFGGKTFSWAYGDGVTTETYPDGSTIARTFDCLGRRTSMTDPDGNVTVYHYANAANNKKLDYIDHPMSGRTYFNYDSATGALSNDLLANGASNWWGYDSLNRLRTIHAYDSYEKSIFTQTYTYNAASIPTRLDVYLHGYYGESYEKLYSYDSLLRLTEEHKRRASDKASMWRRAYQYDAAGNRTQMVNFDGSSTGTIDYTYNAGNQLEDDGTNEYMYDNNGNMVFRDDGSNWMYYDHNRENRLVSVEEGVGFRAFYYYDAMGRRIVREGGNSLLRYYYDGLNILMVKEKPDGCSSWRTKKVYTLKQAAIGQIISERENTFSGCGTTPSSSTDRWYHYDRLGNVMALTDADSGPAIAVFDQEAFGNVLSGSQAGFHLTTKEYEGDAELYYFNARWYSPSSSLFLEHDPVRWEPIYAFCRNNPAKHTDPSGMSTKICCRTTNMPCFKQAGIQHCSLFINGAPYGQGPGSCGGICTVETPNGHMTGDIECTDAGCPAGSHYQLSACMKREAGGLFFPFVNDCVQATNQCLKEAGCTERASRLGGIYDPFPNPPYLSGDPPVIIIGNPSSF